MILTTTPRGLGRTHSLTPAPCEGSELAELLPFEHPRRLVRTLPPPAAQARLIARLRAHDPLTAEHCERVVYVADAIGAALQLGQGEAAVVSAAARLHDIGKLAVPASILTGTVALTSEEWELVRTHAQLGACALQRLGYPPPIVDAIRLHHENVDGSGYPYGLHGPQIPLSARILRVADTLDAMLAGRTYQARVVLQVARTELRTGRASRFCPRVVDALALIDWDELTDRTFDSLIAA